MKMKKAVLGIIIVGFLIGMAISSISINAMQIKSEQKLVSENTIGKPDLKVVYITNLDTIESGEFIEYEVKIKNIGKATAEEEFEIRIYRDGWIIPGGSDYISNLAPGEIHTFTFENLWLALNFHRFGVLVDYNNDINESNEGNNEKYQTFRVGDEPGTGKEAVAKTYTNPLFLQILERFPILRILLKL